MDNVTQNKDKNRKFRKKSKKPVPKHDVRTEKGSMDSNPKSNDINWYTVSEQLLRDAGSFSFNNPLGNTLRVTELSDVDSSITYNNIDAIDSSIPGIMRINYIPTIGYSQDKTSAANIAANALYSTMRSSNSGGVNYDPVNLMMYLLALDSMYSMYAFMARIYGLTKIYSVTNRYWPKAVIEACNVDADDVMVNSANLRYAINIIAKKLNTLCAPAKIKLFDRHFWMNMAVWKDAPYDKSQMYVFVPDNFYYYDETVVPARLTAMDIGTRIPKWTVATLIGAANTMLNALSSSEDIGIISGDLFKAFGYDGSHKLAEVSEDFQVYPVYDETVLSQIQNLRAVGVPDRSSVNIVELTSQDENAGAIFQSLGMSPITAINPGLEFAHILNLNKDLADIQPADVMEATRLTAIGSNVAGSDSSQWILTDYGSEVVTTLTIYNLANGNIQALVNNFTSAVIGNANGTIISNALSAFDWHPLIRIFGNDATTSSISVSAQQPNYQSGNYTIIGKVGLGKLHEVALMGLFGVPEFGQF